MPTAVSPQKRAKIEQVLTLLRQRGAVPAQDYCPRCGQINWNVDLLLVQVQVPGDPGPLPFLTPPRTSSFIPTLTFTCTNCGYMFMHNLNILGVQL